MLSEAILLKRGIRSDALWMHRVVYRSPLRYIPLFLDTWALMRSQYWSRETLAHYQDVRIAELFSEARAVPYWKRLVDDAREKFNLMEGRTLLSQLPVTNKHSLQDVPFEESAFVPLIRSSEKDHTSGSTGMPFHFYHDWGSVLRSCAVTERIFRTVSRSRLPIIYMRARERHGFTFFRHVWFFVRSATSIRFRIEALLSLNDRFRRGYILYGYTSWVLELARIVESTKKTLGVDILDSP